MRHGVTLLETVIALALGLVILAAALQVSRMGDRLGRSAQGSASVTSLRLLSEALIVDLRQLARDPFEPEVLRLTEAGVSFHTSRVTSASIELDSIRWQRTRGPNGEFYLTRTRQPPGGAPASRTLLDSPLSSARFRLITDGTTGGRFLALDVVAADPTLLPGATPESETLVFALRPAGGPTISSLSASVAVSPHAALLPLPPR